VSTIHEDPPEAEPTVGGFSRRSVRIAGFFSFLAGLGFMVVMAMTVADVARRTLDGHSIPGMVELVEVGLAALVFLGLFSAQIRGVHVKTPMVTNMLPARLGHACRALGLLVGLVFLCWMTYETATSALDSFSRGEYRYGSAKVPIWPAKMIIPAGLGALAVVVAAELVTSVRRFVAGAPKVQAEFDGLP